MKADQKSIYFISGNNEIMLKNSPLLESFKEKDIEVLIMSEEIDTIVMPMVNEFDKTPIKPINHSDVDDELGEKKNVDEGKFAPLIIKMKEILKDDVKDVKISQRLSQSPTCLIYDKNDPDFAMQEMLKQMGQSNLPKVKPILEINADHEIFVKLVQNENNIYEVAEILLDLAKLNEGINLENPAKFSQNLSKIIAKVL